MPTPTGYPQWVTKLRERSVPPTDAASNTERTRRAWPFVVTVLAGLTLLYSAPRVAVIAFTLLTVAFGIFVGQRRLRRRQGASTQVTI